MTSTNKQTMERIMTALAAGDRRPFGDAVSDDFAWIFPGNGVWSGAYRGKRVVLEQLMRPLFRQFSGTYTNRALRTCTTATTSSSSVVVKRRPNAETATTTPTVTCVVFRRASWWSSRSTWTPPWPSACSSRRRGGGKVRRRAPNYRQSALGVGVVCGQWRVASWPI